MDRLSREFDEHYRQLVAERDALKAEVEAERAAVRAENEGMARRTDVGSGAGAAVVAENKALLENNALWAENERLRAEVAAWHKGTIVDDVLKTNERLTAELHAQIRYSSTLMGERDALKDRLSIVAKTNNVRGLVERLQADNERLRATSAATSERWREEVVEFRTRNRLLRAELEAKEEAREHWSQIASNNAFDATQLELQFRELSEAVIAWRDAEDDDRIEEHDRMIALAMVPASSRALAAANDDQGSGA